MSSQATISSNQSSSCEAVILTDRQSSRLDLGAFPNHWEISFPPDKNLRWTVFQAEFGRKYGVVIYQFSESETRFVLRGNLQATEDLVACLKVGEEYARQFKSSELVTQEKIRPDWLDIKNIFLQCGFSALDESLVFECPFGPFVERLNRMMHILERNCAVPNEARVTDLAEGRELAGTILEQVRLMDRFDFDHRLSPGAAKPISAEYSQLVWVGKTLAGIILVAPTEADGIYEIPVRYIIPAYRQTWVNALLIHSCVKRGEMMGATIIRFNANSKTHHETIHLATQAGCVLVATSHRYGKLLH